MNNPTVSIIIPLYNGRSYIPQLLLQLERQTVTDFEIVFVDDGSSDGSADLVEEKSGSDFFRGRVRVIREPNLGQGAARNAGMCAAVGEYLIFIDQDDRIDDDYVGHLLGLIRGRSEPVMVVSGYRTVRPDGKVTSIIRLQNTFWSRFMVTTPWGKIYRKSFLEDHKICYGELVLGEDIYFNMSAYLAADRAGLTDRIIVSDYVGYSWVDNRASFSRTEQKNISEVSSVLPVFDKLFEAGTREEWNRRPEFGYYFLKAAIYHLLYTAPSNSPEKVRQYRDELFSWLEGHFDSIWENPLIGFRKPKGERRSIRFAVAVYAILHRMQLDSVFLRFRAGKES